MRAHSRAVWGLIGGVTLLGAGSARANGEAEYVAPVDRPVAGQPGRPLPYPVAEEPAPRGVPSVFLEALPAELSLVSTPALSAGVQHDNVLGEKRRCFASIVLRGSDVGPGKLTIAPGALSYVAESWPGALPLRQDVICIAGVAHTLVDLEQTIVTRKNLTLGVGEAAALGSELVRLRAITELGDARSAVVEITAFSGFDWARLGTGSLELSTTLPGWHAKTFHYGLHQGRTEQVSPKDLRLAWVSGLRTDSVVLAAKRELAAKLAPGTETALGGGARLRVLRVDPGGRSVELETPEGRKTLSAAGDLRGLPADTAARKRLIAVTPSYAFVLVPEASDFAAKQAHVEVYSGLRQHRHADTPASAPGFKTFASAHYTGAVIGLQWVNDRALELTPEAPVLEGPERAFKLVTQWSADGRLEALQVEDHAGGRSAALPAAGRKSLNLLAGAGPTLESVLARSGAPPSAEPAPAAKREASSAPAPSAANAGDAEVSPTSPARIRPALFWICAAAVVGLIIGFGLGRAR